MRARAFVGFLLGLLAAQLPAQTLTAKQIYDKYAGSVVEIAVKTDKGTSYGTGFFYKARNKVLTCWHVVQGAKSISIRAASGTTWRPTAISFSMAGDTALLHLGVQAKRTPIPHGPSDSVNVGDAVVVIGNPEGLNGSLSTGVVAAKRLSGKLPVLQITAPISSGSSGSPVIDSKGRVIGMISATLSEGQNLNLAVGSQGLAWVEGDKSVVEAKEFYARAATAEGASPAAPNEREPKSVASKDEARAALTKEVADYFGEVHKASLRWEIGWAEMIANLNAYPSAKRITELERDFRAAITDKASLSAMKDLAAKSGGTEEMRTVTERARSLAALGKETAKGESDVCKAVSDVVKKRLSRTDFDAIVASASESRVRLRLGVRELFDAIIQSPAISAGDFEKSLPQSFYGAVVMGRFQALPEPDLVSEAIIRRGTDLSGLKPGDVVLGIKVEGDAAFLPVKVWSDAYQFVLTKGPNLVLQIRRAGVVREIYRRV